jgi:hypothetical protein
MVTTRPEMQGPPMPVPPRTTNLCITPLDVTTGRILIPSMPACGVDGGTWEGAVLNLTLTCKGLPSGATISGSLQVADKAFSGTVIVVLQPAQEGASRGHVTYHETGQWMAADCPASPLGNPLATGK